MDYVAGVRQDSGVFFVAGGQKGPSLSAHDAGHGVA
jgi:hypothetical protein